jgi:hypothetical protein
MRSACKYGQKHSSKRNEYKAMEKQHEAEKAPGCTPMIWLDKADHDERRMGLSHYYGQKGCSREKRWDLEIGKGKADMTPASHEQKQPLNDSRSTQPTPPTRIVTRKPVPPSASRQNARCAVLDALDLATAVSADAITPLTTKPIQSSIGRLYSTPARLSQFNKDVTETPDQFVNRIGITNIAEGTWKGIETLNSGLVYIIDTEEKRVAFEKPPEAPEATKFAKLAPLPAISATNIQPNFNFDALLNQDTVMGKAEVAADNGEQAEGSPCALPEDILVEIDPVKVVTIVE